MLKATWEEDMHISKASYDNHCLPQPTGFLPLLFLTGSNSKNSHGLKDMVPEHLEHAALKKEMYFLFPDARGTLYRSSKEKYTTSALSSRSNYQ